MLLQRYELPIRKKLQRLCIKPRHLSPQHERRSEDAPERHHGLLLVLRQTGHAFLTIAETPADDAERQHVTVRVASRSFLPLPQFASTEHILKKRPGIPEVVCNAPHVGIFCIPFRLCNLRRSGGERQDDRPVTFFYCFMKHTDLGMCSRGIFTADVITFDKIHSPSSVQFEQRIIIQLGFRDVRAQTVHIRIPAADVGRIRNFIRCKVRPEDRHMTMCRKTRDAPHYVDPEFQSE